MLLQIEEWLKCCGEGEKEAREYEENSPPVRKRREGRAEFNFGGNDVSADRGFASTTQQQNSNKA